MSQQLILITGATGHLGFRTLVLALQAGYRVRVALRKAEQIERIKRTTSVQPYLDSIEFTHVLDITAADAYNEAIRGVDGVIHIASPIYSGFSPDDRDWKKLLYDPAEKGTLSMITAAAKESSVKRVVITSSVATLELKDGKSRIGPYDQRILPDEETRNNLPAAASAYSVSKLLAHVAATEFVQNNHVKFDLVRVLPGYIQGANELYTSAEEMRDNAKIGSNEGTINTALGRSAGHPRLTHQVFLDDVAKAHVFALKPEVAKNRDNLLVAANGGDSVSWNDYVPVIENLFPDAVAKGLINPKAEDDSVNAQYDVSSSEKALGFKFAGTQEIVKSVVGQYLDLATSA